MNIRDLFGFPNKLPIEVVQAYYNRLPNDIGVSWFRDGDFIIGEIEVNGNKFTTQGRGGIDFIDMVNDAVISMEIPQKDVAYMKRFKAYIPPVEELQKLGNPNISKASILLEKNKKRLQTA